MELRDLRERQRQSDIIILSCPLTSPHVFFSQHGSPLGRGETEVCQTHGGGQCEGDGEPDQASYDKAPDSLQWFGSY